MATGRANLSMGGRKIIIIILIFTYGLFPAIDFLMSSAYSGVKG
jgi:hypothetical protein